MEMQSVWDDLKNSVAEMFKPFLKPLAKALCVKVVFPLLEAMVKKTSTPIDDLVLAKVEEEVLKKIDEWAV